MYGIFGVINDKNITSMLLQGLQRLENNSSYNSISIATIADGRIQWQQKEELHSLMQDEEQQQQSGEKNCFGIVYTHWINQSKLDSRHSSFYASECIAVVHHGVIENYYELRDELIALGYEFEGKTNSEIILRFINRYLDIGLSPKEAISVTIMRLQGSFALITLFADGDNQLIAARRGSPLAIGLGENVFYVSSDINTLILFSPQVIQLEEGGPAVLSSVKNYPNICYGHPDK